MIPFHFSTCIAIQSHYDKNQNGRSFTDSSLQNKKDTPMDLEWAKDGLTGELFIVQARPETVHSHKERNKIKKYELKSEGKVLTTGAAIGTLHGIFMSRIGHWSWKSMRDQRCGTNRFV